jgi:hypothetical protein
MSQINPDFKKAMELKVEDANFLPVTNFCIYFICPFGQLAYSFFMTQDEHHAIHPKYLYAPISEGSQRCRGGFAWQETRLCRRFLVI